MTSDIRTDLPIEPLVPTIREALSASPNLVLEAPPGAGKTTRVPLALLGEAWSKDRRIIVLEPRRLAARAAAQRMAGMLGEDVGETVGYRVRADRRVGARTRIEIVTTGLFLRQLQKTPDLPGYAAILFDEFHERTMDGDLALALALDAQAGLRNDLRLVVMSATLDGASLAGAIPGATLLRSEGRSFAVATVHLGDDAMTPLEERVMSGIRAAWTETADDVLVFLPGLKEIRRQKTLLDESFAATDAATMPLHGDLSLAEQDRAIRPHPEGKRKIILATSIAETSLTIEGISAVVDSGLKRRPRFDAVAGMSRLATVRISLASANQRRGRAGRTGPGRCYRLWSSAAERGFAPFDAPEIEDCDLAPLALELAIWGVADPVTLPLLAQPNAPALERARDLLRRLGAIDAGNLARAHGRAMAELGAHPRLAHMMLRAGKRGQGDLACEIAALLSERDMIRERAGGSDVRYRLAKLSERGARDPDIDHRQLSRIRQAAQEWKRQLGAGGSPSEAGLSPGAVLALAYPDRLAQRTGPSGQFRLANGRGAMLDPADPLAGEDYLAVGSLDGDKRWARIFLAAPISLDEIEADFADAIVESESIAWNPREQAVESKRERRLWSLVLKQWPVRARDLETTVAAMIEGVRSMGLDCLPWNDECRNLQARVAFLRRVDDEAANWPDMGDGALVRDLECWLAPYLSGLTRRQHLQRVDLYAALLSRLDWRQRKRLEELAPTHLEVPSGSRVALDYGSGDAPVLKVRLQEMFGLRQTPSVAGGRVQVVLHLLSPAGRPVQVTRDLDGFWANSYRSVKADLKGQYPRHFWPDDPLTAEPTRRAKPRLK